MSDRIRVPGEWEPHAKCWLAFPFIEAEWPGKLDRAQRTIAELAKAISQRGGEPVGLLVSDEAQRDKADALVSGEHDIELVVADFGDCWLRDTGPLLGLCDEGLGALRFRFNGWGGKFDIPNDDKVGAWLTTALSAKSYTSKIILEGGAIEFDGSGTCITTASCTLNKNRNPGLTPAKFTAAIESLVECERIVWLERGLLNDHTDGHVDMIARFIGPNRVVCMTPTQDDPNKEILTQIEATLHAANLEVHTLPSPGQVLDSEGNVLPATYCNFYIAEQAVISPTYGVASDEAALERLRELFPGREVFGLDGRDLLTGGGAFHCATQPEPRLQ